MGHFKKMVCKIQLMNQAFGIGNFIKKKGVNREYWTPLDIAVMSNHVPMAKMLMAHGARENPEFQKNDESRALMLINLVNEAERQVEDISAIVAETNKDGTNNSLKDHERCLSHWEYKHKLLKKMKQGYDAARVPDAPTNVTLTVASANSLLVKFSEPLNSNGAVVTRYKVEWSCYETFNPKVGEQIIDQVNYLCYEIQGLTQGNNYYVRVQAWNMKGFGPTQISDPPYAIPSSWREVDNVQPRVEGKLEQLDDLFANIKQSRPADASEIKEGAMGQASSPMHPRKSNMRRSLKNLFASAPKFQKSLKRGVYLASLMYSEDRILVTNEDNLPLLEVDESFSSNNLYSDFHWLMKIACTWEDVKSLKNDMDKCHNSSTILFRNKLLQAAAQLQSALGMQDLGQFFHKPVKDSSGSIVFVTVNQIRDPKVVNTTHVKWMPLSKIQKRLSSSMENLNAPDFMGTMLPEMIEYHSASCTVLSKGLYLGYLKLKSSVDLIKIMVPEKSPNVVPYVKIQDCPNVSKEEWQWLRNLSINDVHSPPTPAQMSFQHSLVSATNSLLESLGISEDEAVSHRIYDLEVIEFNEDVSFILLVPPIEGVCSLPGHSEEIMEKPQYLTKPVQAFEMTHMCTYQHEFITRYSRLSSIIEMDTYLAQQSQREAFSAEEISAAKDRVELLGKFQQKLDEAWKGVRWTMDIITYARDKSVRGGLPLGILFAPPPSPNYSPTMDRKEVDAVASSCSSDMGYHSDRSSGEQNMEEGKEDKRSDCMCSNNAEEAGEDVWQKNTSQPGILRVYAAYPTGLTRGTSVKLHVTPRTTSREVINLVVQQLNRATMIKGGVNRPYYSEEQLEEFCLVAVIGARERVVRDDYQPLQLQNPWTKGHLFVRLKKDTFAALEQGHVTSV